MQSTACLFHARVLLTTRYQTLGTEACTRLGRRLVLHEKGSGDVVRERKRSEGEGSGGVVRARGRSGGAGAYRWPFMLPTHERLSMLHCPVRARVRVCERVSVCERVNV